MKRTSKVLSVLLALTMCLSLLPVSVFAADPEPYATLDAVLTTGAGETAGAKAGVTTVTLDYSSGYKATVGEADPVTVTGLGSEATVWDGQTLKITTNALTQALASDSGVTLNIKNGASVVLVDSAKAASDDAATKATAEQYVFAPGTYTQLKGYFQTSGVDTTYAINDSHKISVTFAPASGTGSVTTRQGTETESDGGVVSNGFDNSGFTFANYTINSGVTFNVAKTFRFEGGDTTLTNKGTISVANNAEFRVGHESAATLDNQGTIDVSGTMILDTATAKLAGNAGHKGTINVNGTLNVLANGGEGTSYNTINVRNGGTFNVDGSKLGALIATNGTTIVANSGAKLNYGTSAAPNAVKLLGPANDAPDAKEGYLVLKSGTLTLAKNSSNVLATLDGEAEVPAGNYWNMSLGGTAYDLNVAKNAVLNIYSNTGDGSTGSNASAYAYGFAVAGALKNAGTINIGSSTYAANMGVLQNGSVVNAISSDKGTLNVVNGTLYVDHSGCAVNVTNVGAKGAVYAVSGASSVTVENGAKATGSYSKSDVGGVKESYATKYTAAEDILHFDITKQGMSWWNGKTTADYAAEGAITFEKATSAPAGYTAQWNVTGTLKSADAKNHMGQTALRYDNFLPLAILLTDGASDAQANSTWAKITGKDSSEWHKMEDSSLVDEGDKGLGILQRVNDLTAANTGLADGQFKVEVVTGVASAEEAAAATEKEVYLIDVSGVAFERGVTVTVKASSNNEGISGAVATLTGGSDTASGTTTSGGVIDGNGGKITTTLTAKSTTYTASVSGYTINKMVVTRKDSADEIIGSKTTLNAAPWTFTLDRYNADQVEVEIFVTEAGPSAIADPTFEIVTGTGNPLTGKTANDLIDQYDLTPSVTYASTNGKVKTYDVTAELNYINGWSQFSADPLDDGHYLVIGVKNPGVTTAVASNAKFALVGELARGDWSYAEFFADGTTADLSMTGSAATDFALMIVRVDDIINGTGSDNNEGAGYFDLKINWGGATSETANTNVYRFDLSGVKLKSEVAKDTSTSSHLGNVGIKWAYTDNTGAKTSSVDNVATTNPGTNSTQMAPAGKTVHVKVADNNGYTVDGITVYKTEDTSTTVPVSASSESGYTYAFVMPNYPVTIKAAEKLQGYPVTILPDADGNQFAITKVVTDSKTYTNIASEQNTINNTTIFPLNEWDGMIYVGRGITFTVTSAVKPGYVLDTSNGVKVYTATAESSAGSPGTNRTDSITYTATDGSGGSLAIADGAASTTNIGSYGIILQPYATKDNLTVGKDAASKGVDMKFYSSDTEGSGTASLTTAVGEPVHVWVKATSGYESITVTNLSASVSSGAEITVDDALDNGYVHFSFTMPGKSVTVLANAQETPKTIAYANTDALGGSTAPAGAPTSYLTYQVTGTNASTGISIPAPAAVEGYTFQGWKLGGAADGTATTSFKLISSNTSAGTDNVTLTAVWKSTINTLSSVKATISGADYTVAQNGTAYSVTVPANATTVSYTAAATAGSHANVAITGGTNAAGSVSSSVTLSDSEPNKTVEITVTPDGGAAAKYTLAISRAAADQFPVTVPSSVSNGTFTTSVSSAAAGTTVSVTATPNIGYKLTKFMLGYTTSGGPQSVNVTSGTTFTMPSGITTGGVTVTPEFALDTYKISYDLNGGAWASDSNKTTAEAITYQYDAGTKDISGIPNPVRTGYKFLGWTRPAWGDKASVTNTATDSPAVVDLAGYAANITLTAKWQSRSSDTGVESGDKAKTFMTLNGTKYAGYVDGSYIYFPAPDTYKKIANATFTIQATALRDSTGAADVKVGGTDGGTADKYDNAVLTSGSLTSGTTGIINDIPYNSNGMRVTVKAPNGSTKTYSIVYVEVFKVTSSDANVDILPGSTVEVGNYYVDGGGTLGSDNLYLPGTAVFRVAPKASHEAVISSVQYPAGTDLTGNANGDYTIYISDEAEVTIGEKLDVTLSVAAPEIDAEKLVSTTGMTENRAKNIDAVQSRATEISLTSTGDTGATTTIEETVNEVLGDATKAAEIQSNVENKVTLTEGQTVEVNVTVTPTFDVQIDKNNSSETKVTIKIEPQIVMQPVATVKNGDGSVASTVSDIEPVVKKVEITAPQAMHLPISDALQALAAANNNTLTIKHIKYNEDGSTKATYFYDGDVSGSAGAYYLDFVNPNGFSDFEISAETAPVKIGATGYATLKDAVDAVNNGETIVLTSTYSGAATAQFTNVTATNGTAKTFTIDASAAITAVKDDFAANYASRITAGTSTVTGYDVVATSAFPVQFAENVYKYSFELTPSDGEAAVVDDGGSGTPTVGIGGGAAAPRTVSVTVSPAAGGSATATANSVTIKVNAGYRIAKVTVNGAEVTIPANGVITGLKVSDKVVVTFEKKAVSTTGFTDVPATAYYANAVKWAVEKGVTNGKDAVDTFKPNDVCTRAEAVTFLYRAAGSPEVEVTAAFKDVAADTYYAKAVAWAVANGITNGKNELDTFLPNDVCSRAEIVTFLARYEKATAGDASAFTDVNASEWYAGSVGWAVANGITNGKDAADTFKPADSCTRAEIVTFLYRDMVK